MLDPKKFNEGMAILCEMFDRQATDFLLKGYYMVLKDLSPQEFETAIGYVLESHKFCKMPLPAEIKECIRGNQTDKAILALDKLERAMSSVGKYRSIVFDDPLIMAVVSSMGGWPKLCSMDADEWKWSRKDFEKIYRAYSAQPLERLQIPERLAGIAERDNGAKGFDEVPQIAFVGERHVPLLTAS